MKPNIIPTAEPFFFPGGRIGCLLVHGFTGTPKELRWMGEYLSGENYTVLGIRLPGHATRPADMQRARWPDWLAAVEDGWHLLNGTTEQVFVIGLSMGGILSLLFASRCLVAGVVAMSTPYRMPADPRLRFIGLISPFFHWIQKGKPDWRDPEAARVHVDYPAFPTRSIIEVRDMLAVMREALPLVTAPVLLINSRQDLTVSPINCQSIYERLGSSEKSILWVEDSGHVITCDSCRQQVFQATSQFIHQVSREN